MSGWQANFEVLRQEYLSVFEALQRALLRFEIDFYLIGAQSRDVWIRHLNLSTRATRDIDYTVFVPDRETWDNLVAYLVTEEGFEPNPKAPYRFTLKGQVLDLIPFGGIDQDGSVAFDNPKMTVSVIGCKEVTGSAIQEGAFKIITLPGLCILKLVAFSEKPEWRKKDWDDVLFLIEHYGDIVGDELWDPGHEDLMEDEDFETRLAAARILGRAMRPTLQESAALSSICTGVLEAQLQGWTPDEIDFNYRNSNLRDAQVVRKKMISEVLKGIGGN